MKMLRWRQAKTRKQKIKNETISGIEKVTPIKSVVIQKRLSWYCHMACGAKGRYPHNNKHVKGALYIIWCGVNRLGDSGVKVV